MLRHSQNMNGSRTEPQTAVSTLTSSSKTALASLVVNVMNMRKTSSVFAMEIQFEHYKSGIERCVTWKLGFFLYRITFIESPSVYCLLYAPLPIMSRSW